MHLKKSAKVRDIMTTPVITVELGTGLIEAIKKMNKYRIGSIVIVRSERIAGIITERDILKVIEHNPKLEQVKVEDIMTPNIHVVRDDASLKEVAKIMSEKKVRRLPVVRGDNLVGLITSTDIVKAVAEDLMHDMNLHFSDILFR
ncbi:MAG: CBS domain-containing protein [Nitrososphaerales archaeon]